MKTYVLSSQECENKEKNNGDCFVLDNGEEVVIFDCGCQEFANWVTNYIQKEGYSKIKVVLSHNDDDHFKGIPILVEKGIVSEITTVLLLKYVDELLDIIDDGRKNRESIKKQILDTYDNIKALSGCGLQDALEYKEIAKGIKVIGPSKEYILNAAAKGLDTRESDTIDNSTITNATSIHLEVQIGDKKLLLTGDSSFESVMEENIKEFKYIQLPHHGNAEIGEKILNANKDKVDTTYIISDNTGNSNGGSDKIKTKGYSVINTKIDGTLEINESTIDKFTKKAGCLGKYDIFNIEK
ncbi:MAG: MBL fold metallo-hydrolase [Clostridia bacterium]|nr:MBL fold metallo-hydrolase [Clostridia bacterium]